MANKVSPHFPLVGLAQETFTGSKTGITIDKLATIEKVMPIQVASLAADVNKAVKLSIVIAADKHSFSCYAWKATAAGTTTLIAATAAVTVDFLVFGQQ